MARYGRGWKAPNEESARTAPFLSQGIAPREEPNIHEEDIDTDAYGNETRRLVGTQAAFQTPWRKDKRWWVRWPAQVWQVTGQWVVRRVRLFRVRGPLLISRSAAGHYTRFDTASDEFLISTSNTGRDSLEHNDSADSETTRRGKGPNFDQLLTGGHVGWVMSGGVSNAPDCSIIYFNP